VIKYEVHRYYKHYCCQNDDLDLSLLGMRLEAHDAFGEKADGSLS